LARPICRRLAEESHLAARADRRRLFDHAIAVNLRSPLFLVQAALPGMRERGFGRILFMSSAAAFRGGLIGAHYAASGLHGMTHYLSAQLAGEGFTVNAIAPGFIATEMLPGDSFV
jgi:3-oxoacyl-[acyl-carrier protein] reductase